MVLLRSWGWRHQLYIVCANSEIMTLSTFLYYRIHCVHQVKNKLRHLIFLSLFLSLNCFKTCCLGSSFTSFIRKPRTCCIWNRRQSCRIFVVCIALVSCSGRSRFAILITLFLFMRWSGAKTKCKKLITLRRSTYSFECTSLVCCR